MNKDAELYLQQVHRQYRICIWRKIVSYTEIKNTPAPDEVLYKGDIFMDYDQVHSDRNLDLDVLILRLQHWCDDKENSHC